MSLRLGRICGIFGVMADRVSGWRGAVMADENAIGEAKMSSAEPIVHAIGPGDLRDALVKGIADFEAMPTHLVSPRYSECQQRQDSRTVL